MCPDRGLAVHHHSPDHRARPRRPATPVNEGTVLHPNISTTPNEEIILGVDTHNDAHVAAVISALGMLLACRSFPATAAGYTALLNWARSHGRLERAGVEGTSSHGTALTRYLHRHQVQVIEVNRPDRAVRRRRGKSDAVDAENAARAVLSGQARRLATAGDALVETTRT